MKEREDGKRARATARVRECVRGRRVIDNIYIYIERERERTTTKKE